MHSGLSLFLEEYPWSSSPARVLCTVRSTSTQAWSNGQPNGSVGLHPPGQISIACVARESRCWSVYPQVCLLWAVTAKVLHVCENSTKKPQNVQSIGTIIQKSKNGPKSMAFLPFTRGHGTHQLGAPFAVFCQRHVLLREAAGVMCRPVHVN